MVAVAVVCLMLPTLTSDTTGSGGKVVKVSVTVTVKPGDSDACTSYSVSSLSPVRAIDASAVVLAGGLRVLFQSPCGVVVRWRRRTV